MHLNSISPDSGLLARPIILIGAGRSGSTLFARMLDGHPRIQFLGETDFLIPRLWREVWGNRFWFNFTLHMARSARSSREPTPSIDKYTNDAERERVASFVRGLFANLLSLRSDVGAWGFKEIWNGNEAVGRFSWDDYDVVFPKATWVHLVRNPFDFLVSVARWNVQPLTKDFITLELAHWAQMLVWNRQRSTQRQFVEICYEDLLSRPKDTLQPILSKVGVDWSDECLSALSSSVMKSSDTSPFSPAPKLERNQLRMIVAQIENLERFLDELGYDIPNAFPQEIMDPKIIKKRPEYVDLRRPTHIR